jgi:hypothetical protein
VKYRGRVEEEIAGRKVVEGGGARSYRGEGKGEEERRGPRVKG